MNALVRGYLLGLYDTDEAKQEADRSIRAIAFPDGEDPLRVFLRSFPEQTGGLIDLVHKMDALRDEYAAQEKPLSGSSTSTDPEEASSRHEAQPTDQEALRRIGDKRTKKVTRAVKEVLGRLNPRVDFVPFRIEHDTQSAYRIVRDVYEDKLSHKVMRMLRKTLEGIDEAFSAEGAAVARSSQVAVAFQSEYRGYAHNRLFDYVQSCWNKFCKHDSAYTRPYCAIVQSSGFGKSRLLRELAVKTKTVTAIHMHVMYLCVRDSESSSGYPIATSSLREHFFPADVVGKVDNTLVDELAGRLLIAFEWAMRGQAARVHETLMGLFDGKERDLLKDLRKRHNLLTPTDTKTRAQIPHLLVFAIDEARALLPSQLPPSIGWFRVWRRALSEANKHITIDSRWPKNSGIFGIVVDTNSKVADFVPSTKQDPSSRPDRHFRLFPAFVLTDTMDVLYPGESKVHQYEKDVLQAVTSRQTNPTSVWKTLKLLGRPLWITCDDDVNSLSAFAAKKLLLGKSPHKNSSLDEDTMYGVASVLCRVGLRPYSSSSLASRTVADFMAVLSYVGYEHDQFISSYSSDPVLTLGATRIWHGVAETALAETILPQFRKIMHQELMDTGGAGEMVARIVLLLAMDACGVLETGDGSARWSRAGAFASVWTFLTALHGDAPKLKRTVRLPNKPPRKADGFHWECCDSSQEDLDAALEALKSDWKGWCVSFTHFVQLVEHPSEDCLWAMLARRAAGAFPRGQKGVDLFIPICTLGSDGTPAKARISMILVQVKNWESTDPNFPISATTGTRPAAIFKRGAYEVPKEKKKFQALAPTSVLRIYMSLRDAETDRFYLQDDDLGCKSSFVLCTNGLGRWLSRPDPDAVASWKSEVVRGVDDGQGPRVEVLSEGVAKQLRELLRSWWKVGTLIEEDVRERDNEKGYFGMSKQDLVTYAKRSLPEALLFNDGKLGQLQSRLGRDVGGDDGSASATSVAEDTTSQRRLGVGEDGDTNMDYVSTENDSNDLGSPSPKKLKMSASEMDLN